MSSIIPAANYSFYAIPASFILVLAPQLYAGSIVRNAKSIKLDNANPRGETHAQSIKKNLSKEDFGKFERARAAHFNGYENFPLFAVAVICGNMAKLDPSTLNTMTGLFLVLRTVYNVAYIQTTTQRWSVLRTGVWSASVLCCLFLLSKAGGVMANGGPLAL